MADNWGFVFVAYGLALIVLAAYWRFLVRRERELSEGHQVLREGSGVSEQARHPSP